MSQMTDFMENKLVDMIRAQAWSLGANLYAGLASAASDSSVTEIAGTGYARVGISRALASWAGTQAGGSTTASSGTSHTSSNNAAINFGSAGSAWGSAAFVVLYDASTSGNALCFFPFPGGTLTINNGDPVNIAPAGVTFNLGLSGGCTDYLANKLIDFIFRGQSFTFPATLYKGLFTAAPSNAGGGTEAAHTSYARVGVTGSLANFAGTQSAGSTTASTGTSGKTSNNGAISFASPGSSGPAITHDGWFDASTTGNLLFWAPLNTPRSIVSGASGPVYNAATTTITFA
jgi:hypothetical protein